MGGGLSCVENGELKEHLQLKVAGLMSNKEAEELSKAANKMKKAIRELGITEMPNPLLRVVTLALPVIPCAKMSDCGVVDVLNNKWYINVKEYSELARGAVRLRRIFLTLVPDMDNTIVGKLII